MAKINWQRKTTGSILHSEYYTNPRKGYDKDFWETREKLNKTLGKHKQHNWHTVEGTFGPHKGKLVCKTCNNKFLGWAPKQLAHKVGRPD